MAAEPRFPERALRVGGAPRALPGPHAEGQIAAVAGRAGVALAGGRLETPRAALPGTRAVKAKGRSTPRTAFPLHPVAAFLRSRHNFIADVPRPRRASTMGRAGGHRVRFDQEAVS